MQKAPISLNESISSANKLVNWIALYQLGNVAEPWIVAKRLVRHDMPINARMAGFHLFIACVRSRSDLPTVIRLMFFNDILTEFAREDFDHQVKAMIALTRDGGQISALENKICIALASWIDRALANLDLRTTLTRRAVVLDMVHRHEDLRQIINFVINIIKFNFPLIDEEDLVRLVDRTVLVCKRTGEESDIRQALALFDAIIRYGYIPLQSLSDVVHVVCSVHHSLEKLREEALLVMLNLLRSHMSLATLKALRSIIQGNSNVHDDVTMGAVEILTTRWTGQSDDISSYTYTVMDFFSSLAVGMTTPSKRLDRDRGLLDRVYLDCVLQVLSNKTIAALLNYEDWDVVIHIFITSYRSLNDRDTPLFCQDASRIGIGIGQMHIHEVSNQLLRVLEGYLDDTNISLSVSHMAMVWSSFSRNLSAHSSEALFRYYADNLSCYPSNPDWSKNIRLLNKEILANSTTVESVRLLVIRHFADILTLVTNTSDSHALHEVILDIFSESQKVPNNSISHEKIAMLILIAQYGKSEHGMRALDLLNEITIVMHNGKAATPAALENSPSFTMLPSSQHANSAIHAKDITSTHTQIPPCEALQDVDRKAVSGLFTVFLQRFTQQPDHLLQHLYSILLEILTSSLRSSQVRKDVLAFLAQLRADSQRNLYLFTTARSDSPVLADPSEPGHSAYAVIRSTYSCSSHLEQISVLSMSRYLESICYILETDADWNLISFCIEVAKQQLCNHQLFKDAEIAILHLRAIICEILHRPTDHRIILPSTTKLEDVVTSFVELLALVVAYHTTFSKAQEDEIVLALQQILLKHQKATPACIHTLTICAYEIPLSTTKSLSSILTRLSHLITSTNASVHILEFLSALARLPEQYVNFREEDYRRIFGVALQHIQFATATAQDAINSGLEDPLKQPMAAYVLTMAFDTIYAWFLAVKLPSRPKYVKLIVDGLLSANPISKTLDASGLVCYDFLARFCYSNAEIKSIDSLFLGFEADQSRSKSWLHGNSILTMKTMNLSGLTEMIVRRPVSILFSYEIR